MKNPKKTKANIKRLLIEKIKVDGSFQVRQALSEDVVNDYHNSISEKPDALPAVHVFTIDGQYWLVDGFHRLEAHRRAGMTELFAEVHAGDNRAALLFAIGANRTHGLRFSNEDKRRAVSLLLKDEEWVDWSDIQIANHCGVSDRFVSKMRKELSPNGSDMTTERKFVRNGSEYEMNTSQIGRNHPSQEETAINPAFLTETPMEKAVSRSLSDSSAVINLIQKLKHLVSTKELQNSERTAMEELIAFYRAKYQ